MTRWISELAKLAEYISEYLELKKMETRKY